MNSGTKLLLGITMTLALFFMAGDFHRGGPGRISRTEGGILLLVFIGYQGWLIASATG